MVIGTDSFPGRRLRAWLYAQASTHTLTLMPSMHTDRRAGNTGRVVRAAILVLALIPLAAGLWAMIDSRSFYLEAATFPPYNPHLLHDIGAFQIGLGVCLAASLVYADALLVVLAGNAAANVMHFVAHVADRDQGGHASDPVTFGVVAALFVALAAVRWRALGPQPRRADL